MNVIEIIEVLNRMIEKTKEIKREEKVIRLNNSVKKDFVV